MSPILGIWASAQQAALLANSYESISTVNVGSGGTSAITFSSIPSTYKHLQVRALHAFTSSQNSATLRFNGDTTASNYRQHHLYGFNTSAGAGTVSSNLYAPYDSGGPATTSPGAMVLDILDYTNTNKYKTVRYINGCNDATNGGIVQLVSGLWMSTSAISSITFTLGFTQYTSFALYGIKG